MDAPTYSSDSGARVKGVSIIKPIIYGNIARYFGKKREEDGHTHQWSIHVKPYRNEDMSVYVKKIHFKLHDSYTNQNRIVTKPPYEVTETGWGEFEIQIKIYFNDPNERPVTLYHLLKLFQSQTDIMLGKKNLVVEHYDELIFQEPAALMQQLLTSNRHLTLGPYKHETDFEENKTKTLEKIAEASKKIRDEIQDLNEKLKQNKENIAKYRDQIVNMEEKEAQRQLASEGV